MTKIKKDEKITQDEIIMIPFEEKKSLKRKAAKVVCNILNKTTTKIYIDFNGYGVMIMDKTPNKTNKVEISYEGEINSSSFKILSHKFI